MVSRAARPAGGLVLALSAALVLLAVVASDGFYIIDEVIYFMGAEAVRSTGGFVLENGHAALPLDALRLWLLVEGPEGLVPQYPVGTALAGALLVIAAVALVAGYARSRATTGAALIATGAGLGLAMAVAAEDFANTQARRAVMAERSAAAEAVTGPAVFLGPPEGFVRALGNPDHLLAVPDRLTHRTDPATVAAICAAGYRLILPERSGSVAGHLHPLDGAAGLAEVDCDRAGQAHARRF